MQGVGAGGRSWRDAGVGSQTDGSCHSSLRSLEQSQKAERKMECVLRARFIEGWAALRRQECLPHDCGARTGSEIGGGVRERGFVKMHAQGGEGA